MKVYILHVITCIYLDCPVRLPAFVLQHRDVAFYCNLSRQFSTTVNICFALKNQFIHFFVRPLRHVYYYVIGYDVSNIVPPMLQRDWSMVIRLASRSNQSDVVSTRFDSRIGHRTKSNMFDSSDRLSDRSNKAFTRYDRQTDRSDCPDDRTV